MTIAFDTDGNARCLYSEEIDLSALGELTVTRASTVEFEPVTQEWEVRIDGLTKFFNKSRARCLEWEREYFEERL